MGNVQSKNRESMQPQSMEKRCLFRAEVLQEIAVLSNANNRGLQTVDEAAAADEAAGADEAAAADTATPVN